MNCTDITALSPRYLSGELEPGPCAEFAEHLKSCPDCAREIDSLTRQDALLREAERSMDADTTALDRRIRERISSEASAPRAMRWMGTAAAAVIALLLGGFALRVLLGPHPTGLYGDATLDHRLEVIDRQPRRWISGKADLEALTARQGLPVTLLASLAPAAYRLERGKLCRLDGRVFLHLVYSDGARETSVFVRSSSDLTIPGPARESIGGRRVFAAEVGEQSIAALQDSRLTALFVASGHGPAAMDMAREAARAL